MLRYIGIALFMMITPWGDCSAYPVFQQDPQDSYALEKLYLHTDRGIYSKGQNIYFKAYLLNSVTHIPSTISQLILVELWSPASELIARVNVHSQEGLSNGNITLPEDIIEGNYLLRAYTRYQLNGTPELIFRKTIKIRNEGGELPTSLPGVQGLSPGSSPYEARKPDIKFLPEGGHMINGQTSTLGFKGVDTSGRGFKFRGEIWNNKQKVGEFSSNELGMGKVLLIPQSGMQYYALIDYEGKQLRYELPEARDEGYLLTAKKFKNKILAQASYLGKDGNSFELVIHSRGSVLSIIPSDMGSVSITIETSQLPEGIITLSLVDQDDKIVAERLLFNDPGNSDDILIDRDTAMQKTRSRYEMHFRSGNQFVNDSLHLSMSICRPEFAAGIESNNILSYLLLSSDLRGFIENPGWYFSNKNPSRETDMDNLLLTQGWRRYESDNTDLMANQVVEPDLGIDVAGKLVNFFDHEKAVQGTVHMTFKENLLYQEQFETDDEGNFLIDNLSFYDTLNLVLQSTKTKKRQRDSKRKDALHVILNDPKYPSLSYHDSLTLGLNALFNENLEYQQIVEKINEINLAYFVDSSVIVLEEVQIEARTLTVDEQLEEGRNIIYQNPDRRMVVDSITLGRSKRLIDLLRRVPGIQIVGRWPDEEIRIRGAQDPPIFTMDGIIMDWEFISNLFGDQIEFIDVLYGARSAVYGMRGGTGVIAIYSRMGNGINRDADWGIGVYKMVGYQTPAEFYSPDYEVKSDKHVIPDFRPTLFWEPTITIKPGETTPVTFHLSDEEADYLILVEGASSTGKIIRRIEQLSVGK